MTEFVRTGGSITRAANDRTISRVNHPPVAVTVAGNQYALVTEHRCHVCRSAQRSIIENFLLEGMPYKWVCDIVNAEREADDPKFVSAKSIARHVQRNHLPVQAALTRSVMETRMRELGQSIEEAVDSMADHIVVGRTMLAKYFARLARDQIEVTGTEAVALIRMFTQLEQSTSGSLDNAAYNQVLSELITQIEVAVGPEKAREILYRTNDSPVVRAVMAQREALLAAT